MSEPACPFCGAMIATGSLVSRAASRPAVSPQTLGRAAIFAFGSAIATSATGCYLVHERGEPAPRPAIDAWQDDDGGSIGFLYGTPPEPEGVDASALASDAGADAADSDAAIDEGAPVTLYGGPAPLPLDAGPREEDAGGDMPVYGGPPEP